MKRFGVVKREEGEEVGEEEVVSKNRLVDYLPEEKKQEHRRRRLNVVAAAAAAERTHSAPSLRQDG